ncbi:hypothetical protein PoB_005850800 [Plakobranchus ocellatus]|uniref:Uncharacterized protein n=1 Tax=Plakobranchus ocellatus TaxID=259542 RepID=A0AAV4CJ49_9GAST|nr:hypothetical protein PoB_005850800 [Plakobranchus ocellatus]
MSNLSVMAMKEATDLTWSQLRQQRRYLKEAGLLMPSESKQRQAMEDLAADNIVTQMIDFVDSYGQTHRAAFGRVTNITTFVTKFLEQHKLHITLTWHNSTIPHDECATPYLHILLGIVLKHHRMLEESTHKIDMQIASALDTDFTEIAESVYSYGKNWTRAEQIKEKKSTSFKVV